MIQQGQSSWGDVLQRLLGQLNGPPASMPEGIGGVRGGTGPAGLETGDQPPEEDTAAPPKAFKYGRTQTAPVGDNSWGDILGRAISNGVSGYLASRGG